MCLYNCKLCGWSVPFMIISCNNFDISKSNIQSEYEKQADLNDFRTTINSIKVLYRFDFKTAH